MSRNDTSQTTYKALIIMVSSPPSMYKILSGSRTGGKDLYTRAKDFYLAGVVVVLLHDQPAR